MQRYKAVYKSYAGGKYDYLFLANNKDEAEEKAKKRVSIISQLIEVIEW
jgi:hypothetical protein